MTLASGTKLGPYEIVAPLGAGGMGQVYRGRDTRLDRDVAIKVLPPHLADDPELRRRFEREARVISSLSHPHICTLFDIGRHEGLEFIVMELIEGESLAQRLYRGPLVSEQVLKTGIEIADALEKAHKQGPGIVHRDLKPANIMLTKSGAKLLDFGLAKYTAAPAQRAAISSMATADRNITEKGEIVGTLQYMAPEQLEGKEADARTDIFALGTVLYEMATGRPAFQGKTRAGLIGNIMNSEPVPITALQPLSPPALDRVIKACLAKDPDERWQTAHDLKLELKWALEAGSQAGVPMTVAARRRLRERSAWISGAVLAAVALALGIGYVQRTPKPLLPIQFTIESPTKEPFEDRIPLSLSPDGQKLAFVQNDETQMPWVWVRGLGSSEPVKLEATAGASRVPAWSADSNSLFFSTHDTTRNVDRLKRVPISGGTAEILCDLPSNTWFISANRNDQLLLVSPDDTLKQISISDCAIKPAAPLDRMKYDVGEGWPTFLPDGQRFVYVALRGDKRHDVYAGSLDGQLGKLLLHNSAAPTFAGGKLFFARDGYLYAQPFDPDRLALSGKPVQVLRSQLAFAGVGGFANYAVAQSVLAYHEQLYPKMELAWWDLKGTRSAAIIEPSRWENERVSPDGRKILASNNDPLTHSGDLWMIDAIQKTATAITHDSPFGGVLGVWSPDGKRVALAGAFGGASVSIFIQANDGSRTPLASPDSRNDYFPMDWSPDGTALLYWESDNQNQIGRYSIYPLAGNSKPYPLFGKMTSNVADARFSPDGKWIAFSSDQTERSEVYIAPLAGSGTAVQISTKGGQNVRWMPYGKHLLYLAADHQVVSTALALGEDAQAVEEHALFQLPLTPANSPLAFEIAPDGKRLLLAAPVGRASAPITVLVNWQSELSKEVR
jgi:serine/threonine protein kinase/Tol biopolymer transport system component